jgi:hypothetical protein
VAVKAEKAERRRRSKPRRRSAKDTPKAAKAAPARPRRWRRLAVQYDINGPRVRLGILWFLVTVAALVVGVGALALVYGLTAAAAALQTARAWRYEKKRPHRLTAALGALGLTLAAAVDTALLGLALLAYAAAAYAVAVLRRRRRSVPLEDAGWTLQCGLFVGLAAASVVLSYRFEVGAAISLIVLVAAYETGDYLIGSGAGNSFEGPVGGLAAVLVVTFTIALLRVPPFEAGDAWVFGGLTAVLAPLGQLAGSALLPSYAAKAPALRRLDSLLLLAPLWAWATGILAARGG